MLFFIFSMVLVVIITKIFSTLSVDGNADCCIYRLYDNVETCNCSSYKFISYEWKTTLRCILILI